MKKYYAQFVTQLCPVVKDLLAA